MTTFLDQAEVNSLTNKVRRPSQVKELNTMGIEHRVRGDGSIAILRDHINKVFDGNPDSSKKRVKAVEPNWSLL